MSNKGKIKNRKGKVTTSTHGYTLEIVNYVNCDDIDVLIQETGEIRKHTRMSMFNKGTINPYSISRKYFKEDYLGKVFKNSVGLDFLILNWVSSSEIYVKFLVDDYITRCTVDDINKGQIRHKDTKYNPDVVKAKNRRLGQSKINTQGLKMTIVEYKTNKDMVVQFEDGYLLKTTTTSFDKGITQNPNFPVSKSNYQDKLNEYFYVETSGIGGRIRTYKSNKWVEFLWDDGAISIVSYSNLKKGKIKHPKDTNKVGYMYFIYCLLDKRGEIVYVGQTTDVNKRLKFHFVWSEKSNINKYFKDFKYNIDKVIYCLCQNYDEMMSLEYNLIQELNPIYNSTDRKPKLVNYTTKTYKDCDWKESEFFKYKIKPKLK